MVMKDITKIKMGSRLKTWLVRQAVVLFVCSLVITAVHLLRKNANLGSIKNLATNMTIMEKTIKSVKVKVDTTKSVGVQEVSPIYRLQSKVPSCLAFENVPNIPNKQVVRITHLCSICKQLQTDRRAMDKHAVHINNPEIRLFESLNIQLCKVPKTGCTFMSQVFKIIHDGVYDVFEKTRKFAHSRQTRIKNSSSTLNNLPTVLMARNPYTRLYSAYIDRVYLPPRGSNFDIIRKKILGHDRWCERTPTFLQFLTYIINNAQRRYRQNVHWRPILFLCNPCFTKNIMIIKQESYAADMDNLLEFLNASGKAKETIQEAMTEDRAKVAVFGIIESQLRATSKANGPKQCLTKHEIVKLLWKSFQRQGFIRSNSTFPGKIFRTVETLTLEMCVRLFLSEIDRNGPTPAESKAQRQKYLVEAYRNIPTDVLNNIKAIYREDFLLFDYDFDPPSD